ncbi:MAG: GIY-YIG nuclease family protein [Nitrospira sp.]
MFIYVITNKLNGKQYVGQTVVSLSARWKRHCWPSGNMAISRAIQKHGRKNFKIELLQECGTQEELDDAEVYWATKLNTFAKHGYNMRAGRGRGKMAEDTKKKISAALTGRKLSEDHKQQLSKSHKGLSCALSTKRKLSDLYRGRRLSDLAYEMARLSNAKTYVITSPSGDEITVTNMREHCRANDLSPHKMSEVVNGKRRSHKGWTGRHA